MFKYSFKILLLILSLTFFSFTASAEKINKFIINGNDRITNEYIKLFSEIRLNDDLNDEIINSALKKLFKTGFFKDVSLNFINGVLEINLLENPIIQKIDITGIKAKKIKEPIFKLINLKNRSPLNENIIAQDKEEILNYLKDKGYNFSKIVVSIEDVSSNLVNLTYDINLGNKSIISKITFIGEKFFKDAKLKSIILSEEYKFWKIISGKKFLNTKLIQYDRKLLKNFYKNKGFYNVQVNATFAEYLDNENFELIYNIQSGNKYFFNELKLNLPIDYDINNFLDLEKLFKKLKGQAYSIVAITKILKEIDKITLNKQYEFLTATVNEKIIDNKVNILFNISETQKFYVEKIDIFGNNITREDVIRNQLEVDEGDAFNELLHAKSINNIKSLNFFKTVESEINEGSNPNLKTIIIKIDEKATGEISAGAGVGTTGGTLAFSVAENNFLGRGIEFGSNLEFSKDSVRGLLSLVNPHYLGSDKSIYAKLESSVADNLANYGYKTSKTGFSFGTGMEIYEDIILSRGLSVFQETIKTDSSASANMKKQKGDYFDTYFNYTLDYDKRDQKFQTSDGFRSVFSQKIPVLSDNNALKNTYDFKLYQEWLSGNIVTFNIYGATANSLSNNNIKLSERLFLPSKKLRGFEIGKVGPKDGADYIGGNYSSSINIATTVSQILPNAQNFEFSVFFDAGNIWAVDYDKTIDKSDTIRSSTGIALDWTTPLGPLNFSFAQALTKDTNDKTETFRFNLGTTF